MTIVAGFPGDGFVVLAADSEEGGSVEKTSVRKIALVGNDDCKLLIAGSGAGDCIDFAVQQAKEQLAPPYTLGGVRQRLEDIVTDIYKTRIDQHPESERRNLSFELLCGVWVRDAPGTPQLVRVRRAFNIVKTEPETIGIGSYLARYLIATLGHPNMSMFSVYRLAVYLVQQVKKHAMFCGGTTQIDGLTREGKHFELWPQTVTHHEISCEIVMDRTLKALFYGCDPLAVAFDLDKINEAVDIALKAVRADFEAYLPKKPPAPAPALGPGPAPTPEPGKVIEQLLTSDKDDGKNQPEQPA